MIIDTHAHLMFSQFSDDLDDVIQRAKDSGVEKIINVGCSIESSKQSIKMAQEHDCLYATLGVHPHDAALVNSQLIEEWEKLIKDNEKVVAIGECGLDYVKSDASPGVQKEAFILHLELARKVDLPVIVHNRGTNGDCMKVLNKFADGVRCLLHCFGNDLECAKRAWDRGCMTSFTGIATYYKAEELREVIREVPLDKFMVETDSPFLAPQVHRGRRNEPAYVTEVIKIIADLKGMSSEEIARVSTENALRLFTRIEQT